jgi:hypothetical protein
MLICGLAVRAAPIEWTTSAAHCLRAANGMVWLGDGGKGRKWGACAPSEHGLSLGGKAVGVAGAAGLLALTDAQVGGVLSAVAAAAAGAGESPGAA